MPGSLRGPVSGCRDATDLASGDTALAAQDVPPSPREGNATRAPLCLSPSGSLRSRRLMCSSRQLIQENSSSLRPLCGRDPARKEGFHAPGTWPAAPATPTLITQVTAPTTLVGLWQRALQVHSISKWCPATAPCAAYSSNSSEPQTTEDARLQGPGRGALAANAARTENAGELSARGGRLWWDRASVCGLELQRWAML